MDGLDGQTADRLDANRQIREFQSNPFVAQAKQPTDLEARNPPGGKEFRLVAPTGFEPALPA